MQRGSSCLASFVRKSGAQLAEWKPVDNASALEGIVRVVAKLLNPSISDSAAIAVGPLIATLVTKTSAYLGNYLGEMLKAVLNRLQAAKLPSLIQPLVLVFARLVHAHTSDVLNFLSSITVENTSALQYVLSVWTKAHTDFQGSYYLKISATALAKLYESNDPRLQNIVVPGDLLVHSGEKIVTRSKSQTKKDEYTTVPLKVKIIQLLLQEYEVAIEEKIGAEEEEGDDDEDDWEEVDEDDEEEIQQALGIEGSSFADASLFFGLADEFEDIDDEDDDPEAKNDPLYHIDIKEYVEQFIKGIAKMDPNGLTSIVQHHLGEIDKETIMEIVNGQV